ncbi:MAG: hypothetical protein ABWJ42_07050 [Sulfolobales archaeon]
MSAEDFNKKIDEIFEQAEKRLKEIYEDVESRLEKESWREVVKIWRHEMRSLIRNIRNSLEDLKEEIERSKLPREEVEKIGRYMRDRVESFIDRMNETIDRLEERFEEKKIVFPHHVYVSLRRIPYMVVESIGTTLRGLDKVIRDLTEEISRIAGVPARVSDTEVISSVRIRSEDLKIIDELVEGGIFKSRSEAVSYFTKKGLECSSEWISKALEQIKRIKEIQDSIKKDLEREKKNP